MTLRGYRYARMAMLLLVMTLLFPQVTSAAEDVLQNLHLGHPRLMVSDDQVARVKQLIQTDALAGETFTKLKAEGEKLLVDRTAEYKLIGPRLLDESRRAVKTISTTAGLYRLTGDARYAERARREMLAVCAFQDWHPPHFLDTAEMTNAVAIGYDWTYDRLSAEDRATIRNAIVEKGLNAGLEQYEKKTFWTRANHNWAQVCAGGMTAGALAIADEDRQTASKIIELTRETIARPMAEFAPDGGWIEGPGYWDYATRYTVFYLSALETALGTDFGFLKQPGFANTGMFYIHSIGPTRKSFNFADAHDDLGTAPQLFWLASHVDRPLYAAWERAMNAKNFDIFHLLWFNPDGTWPGDRPPALDAQFKRVNVAYFRSAWADPNAWYVAFKGGDNTANHAHLDLGSFVLDAMGNRWAVDLGSDDYNLPGYFGPQRFTYYRLRTEGHNTLTIDGRNQDAKAKAPLIAFASSPQRAWSIADLSEGYPRVAKSVRRGIELLDRRRVLVQDEIDLTKSADVAWRMHTPSSVAPSDDGAAAMLTQANAKLFLRILSPKNARFEVEASSGPPPQKQSPDVRTLVIRLTGVSGEQRIAVLATSIDEGSAKVQLVPLATWPQ